MKNPELMPSFRSEEEFEEFFRQQRELCDKHRDADGTLSFNNTDELRDLTLDLMSTVSPAVGFIPIQMDVESGNDLIFGVGAVFED